MPLRALTRALALLALVLAPACTDSSGTEKAGPPTKIELASDPVLTATVGTALDKPLVARVRDDRDRPVPGASVRFTLQQGLATLSSAIATTNANGEAQTSLTVGNVAGNIEVAATVSGLDLTVRFSVLAVPGTLARLVVLPKPLRLRAVGDTARLNATLEDQFGNAIPSSGVTWRSLNDAVATVDANGLVTGRTLGVSTQVVASVSSGKADTTQVSVADPNASVCSGAPLSLSPGQAVTMNAATGTCLRTSANADYVAVAYFATSTSGASTDELRIVGSNLISFSGSLAPSPSVAPRTTAVGSQPLPNDAFEAGLREKERRELLPLLAKSREARAARAEAAARYSMIPNTTAVGDLITLNASGTNACTTPNSRVGRVVVMSNKAVIVADTTNPANGFTDDDYRRLATMFDTLVVPVDEQLFGTPSDMDANGRAVVFYTSAVNQLTPPNSGSYIGGFFWARDLYDKTACATSNAGEIFYMLVPDPDGRYGNKFSKAFVEMVTVGTLAHEYQHLINASRRMANTQADPLEASWLNEGLSHIAEEMVFYRATGLQPRSNIGGERFGTASFDQYYLSYQNSNFGRFRQWLLAPETNTPFAANDQLATRGAAWAFLRYAADRYAAGDGDVWYRLVNNRLSGVANFENVFGSSIQTQVRDFAIAMYADDYFTNPASEHRFLSWRLRSAFPVLPSNSLRGAYPLSTRPLSNDTYRAFTLRGGGAAYFPFSVEAGKDAQIQVTLGTGGSPPAAVSVTILRTR